MTREEQEREYFKRGREILGNRNVGGLLATLLKNQNQDLDAAMRILERAATKDDPRQYFAECCKYVAQAKPEKPVRSAVRQKQEIAASVGRFYAHASSRQWHEWDRYLQAQGKMGAIRDSDGGWWFPTQWPPGSSEARWKTFEIDRKDFDALPVEKIWP